MESDAEWEIPVQLVTFTHENTLGIGMGPYISPSYRLNKNTDWQPFWR